MPIFSPKKVFSLSGSNMNFTRSVAIGEEVVEDLVYLGTTGVSGLVPDAAVTEELTIETNEGILNLGKIDVVLDSASQVLASGMLSGYVSGQAGDTIQLSGDNFYQRTAIDSSDLQLNAQH